MHPKGLFRPDLRFAFTNITDEDFTSYWSGQPIVVKAGKTVELSHHLAVKLTRELVDKIIMGEAKLDETEYYKNNPNTAPNMYRSPKGISLGIPAVRKPWEEKICRLLKSDEESPDIVEMRAKLKEELLNNANGEPSREPVPVPVTTESGKLPGVFADLDKKEPSAPKKPLKVKEL